MREFFKNVFSSAPNASWGRLGSALALLATMGWITKLIIQVKDFAAELPSVALFLGACGVFIGELYWISKRGEKNGKDVNPVS